MSLLYMDLDPIDAIIQKLNDEFWKLAATKEEQHHQNALALLDDLASRHIYFQQFRLDMNCRLTHAKLFNSYTEDVLPRAYLYHLPEKLRQMQAQILELIQHVLDTDQESEETVPQKMVSYYKAAGDRAFRFCVQPHRLPLTGVHQAGSEDAGVQKLREILCPDGPYQHRIL